jgi:hypothetical protein
MDQNRASKSGSLGTGDKLGHYQLAELLAMGGMAKVFRAYEATLDRYVALKVCSPTWPATQLWPRSF